MNITYKEFGKLRYLDSFVRMRNYHQDTVGGYQTCIGSAKVEGVLGSIEFINKRGQTAMIAIQLSELSAANLLRAHSLLNKLGLSLEHGMKRKQVEANLGKPNNVLGWPKSHLARGGSWVVGSRQPYIVDCDYLSKGGGLSSVSVYRKDYADREARL